MGSKHDSLQRSFKNQLAGARNPHQVLSSLRPKLSPRQYRAVLMYLPSVLRRSTQTARMRGGQFSHLQNSGFNSALTPPFPRTFEDLFRSQNTLQPISLDRELLWTAERLALYSAEISQFVKLKSQIELAVLSGDSFGGLEILDELERSLGKSFFLIETRLALLQNSRGLEAQKKYLQTIRSAWNRGITPFVAYHMSQKLEFATNPLAFPDRFAAILNRNNVRGGLYEYLIYRVLRRLPARDLWSIILTWEQNTSIIDQYETTLHILQGVVGEPEVLRGPLLVLREVITDPRLQRLAVFSQDVEAKFCISDAEMLVREHLDQGRPGEALESLRADADLAFSAHSIPLEAICKADLADPQAPNDGAPVGSREHIVGNLCKVIRKNEEYDESILDIVRLIEAFSSFSFSKIIKPELVRAATDLIVDLNEDLISAFVADSMFSPEYLTITPSNTQIIYADPPPSTQLPLSSALGRTAPNASRVRNEQLRADLNQFIDENQIEKALDLIVSTYLTNPRLLRMLPIRRTVAAITDQIATKIQDPLALSIVYDLYLRFIGDDRPYIRNEAYEDFLASKGYERASQFAVPFETEDHARLVYFLRFICIPEVMHDSDAFRSSKELVQERLEILTLLREIDPENAAEYDNEVRDITRSQVVQQGLLHVERSKFAINTQPIRRWAEKNLKESYQRSRDLLVSGAY